MAISDAEIIKAVKRYHGNISKAAEYLQCSRKMIYERSAKSDSIKEAIEDARSERNDSVEDTLYKIAVDDENVTALIFIAKTQMGWKEVNKIESETELTVNVKFADGN